VRGFKRALIAPLKWKKASMKIDGQVYSVCFRDALDAIRREVLNTQYGDLYWGPDTTDDSVPDTVLRGAWDGEMYKEQHYHMQGTTRQGTRVLGLHVYSDSTVLSSSGAVSAYPLPMRIVNNINKEVRWVMLAYIPQVESKFLETGKGHEVRAELLQRILHIVFRTCMVASHRGVWVQAPGGGSVGVSPLVLLYVCGQPEERASMCLKGSGCFFCARRVWLSETTRAMRLGPQHRVVTSMLPSSRSSETRQWAPFGGLHLGEQRLRWNTASTVWYLPWPPRPDLETDRGCSIVCLSLTACTYVHLLSNSWSLYRACPLFAHLYCVHRHIWLHSALFYLVWASDILLTTAHLTAPHRIFFVLVSWILLVHFYTHANASTQVMDSRINRKVANKVLLYLRQAAGASGRTRFDTAANAERALNLRFKYASRRLRVPHIHPGYVICGRSAGRRVLVWCWRCSCGVGAIKSLTQREPRQYWLFRTSFFICTAGTLYQKKRNKQR